jgi:beta-lactamase class A
MTFRRFAVFALGLTCVLALFPQSATATYFEPADEMFFYGDDGTFRYYDVGSGGSLGSPILAGDGYSKGWSAVTAVDLDGDGQDEMFFYREDGLFRYYDVRSNGSLGTPLLAGDGYSKNWSSVVALNLDQVRCDDPFTAERLSSLERRFPAQSFTAYVYDTRSGCIFEMNPDARLRTASVFKVMVMAGTLLEAQNEGRPLSSWEMGQVTPMITESANSPVRALWSHFGGSPWFARQAQIFGLEATRPVGDAGGVWGTTTTSAEDQVELLRQVLLGEWGPLFPQYRDEAWRLMTSVVPSQTWGVTEGVPADWVVAQKNGFAGHIANSVGFVQAPGSDEGYVIAVLSNGWSDWTRGVPVVEEIASWVSADLARPLDS